MKKSSNTEAELNKKALLMKKRENWSGYLFFYEQSLYNLNSEENTCAGFSFLTKLQGETCNFINKKALAQVFCEFCEISKNLVFPEHLRASASCCP